MGIFGIGGGMGGIPTFQTPEQMETNAAANLAAASTPEAKRKAEKFADTVSKIPRPAGSSGGYLSPAQRLNNMKGRGDAIRAATNRAPVQASPKAWFGPPSSKWAALDAFRALKAGLTSPEAIRDIEAHGGSEALGAAIMDLGGPYLAGIPGIGEALAYLEIAKQIPLVGDIINSLASGVIDALGATLGGVGDAIGEVPIVGDALSLAKKVPVVGGLLDAIF